MNKKAIKNFAVWARNKLISDVRYKAGLLGVTERGVSMPPESAGDMRHFDIGMKEPYKLAIEQRDALAAEISSRGGDSGAFEEVVEEVAYSWFKRLIAVRFMEVNDYLPGRTRALSSLIPGKIEPDMVTDPLGAGLGLSADEIALTERLRDEDRLDELFRMLFIRQCGRLHEILPELFEETGGYSELLLNIGFTDPDGVVSRLVRDIPEDDFNVEKNGRVEIIGWLYQFYNEERKNEIINIRGGAIEKKDIPAATQLFTPDWVVRYIVDNSLGRFWLERHPESSLAGKLEYLALPRGGKLAVIDESVHPRDIRLIDPCMGSAHFLVYAFDVLLMIYEETGYSRSDAAVSIVENNLYGLEIDKRAYRLAYFALMMKVRACDRHIFDRKEKLRLNIACVRSSYDDVDFDCLYSEKNRQRCLKLTEDFLRGDELGSMIIPSLSQEELGELEEETQKILGSCYEDIYDSFRQFALEREFLPVLKQARILAGKYDVAVTNPPFLNRMNKELKEYVGERFKDYSADLFSVFIYRDFGFLKPRGYSGFMSPYVWMFIKSYEKLREYIINNKSVVTLAQMEYSALEDATVPVCAFVLGNSRSSAKGLYFRLTEFRGGMAVQAQKIKEALNDPDCGYFYETDSGIFSEIPGSPIAYWVSRSFIDAFGHERLSDIARCCTGMQTGDNEKYIRLWYEVPYTDTAMYDENGIFKRYNCGGDFRKWYGNHLNVVMWEDNGRSIREEKGSVIRNERFFFKEGLTWKRIGSSGIGLRYLPEGFIFDQSGDSMFVNDRDDLCYILGFLNSAVAAECFRFIAPTLNLTAGNMNKLPCVIRSDLKAAVSETVRRCIALAKDDWDSFETSWDFDRHPLALPGGSPLLSERFIEWEAKADERFRLLKAAEEELNRVFIDIYGLGSELSPETDDARITVRRADRGRDMRGLISYAVGCMLGRYSLDSGGLAYAGGTWDPERYKTFAPDADNCVPITDTPYFDGDIVSRFVDFVRIVYGEDTLEENLSFISGSLGGGGRSRDVIRSYFLNDFFRDHCRMYRKRPIYWLFDSGRQNGFKALTYMHRWNADTIGNMRAGYLLRVLRVYESEAERELKAAENAASPREKTAALKRRGKLIKQLKEISDYDVRAARLALSRHEIDPRAGVRANLEKIRTASDGSKVVIMADIRR